MDNKTTVSTSPIQSIEEHADMCFKSFQRGRYLVFIMKNALPEDRTTGCLSFLTEEDILKSVMRILEKGYISFDFRNPDKFFSENITGEKAEELGRYWQYFLESGNSYEELNKLTWKSLWLKSDIFRVSALLEGRPTSPKVPIESQKISNEVSKYSLEI